MASWLRNNYTPRSRISIGKARPEPLPYRPWLEGQGEKFRSHEAKRDSPSWFPGFGMKLNAGAGLSAGLRSTGLKAKD
jgi:hypothetical protein